MNQMQRELRRAAAQAFMESLEQLETRLGSEDASTPSNSRKEFDATASSQFRIGDFEAAVADIEQNTRRL